MGKRKEQPADVAMGGTQPPVGDDESDEVSALVQYP